MKKWKVKIEGFAYVEADTEDEAIELFDNGEAYYDEFEKSAEEVDEFIIEI